MRPASGAGVARGRVTASRAESVIWSQVLDFVEDPDDPNEPEHEECLITSRDRSQLLLFITVPDGKKVKNRVHLDLRPVDRTREQEAERILALGASQLADHRRPDVAHQPHAAGRAAVG